MAEIEQDVTTEENEEVAPEEEIRICLFALGGDTYALPVEMVTEIIIPQKISPVPTAPAFVLGVINLRGSIVPIIDVRQPLLLPRQSRPPQIIIIQHGHYVFGILVDLVSEIVSVPESRFLAVPPDSGVNKTAAERNRFFKAIVHRDEAGDAAALLDIDELFEAVKLA